jgi:hypothetical protein
MAALATLRVTTENSKLPFSQYMSVTRLLRGPCKLVGVGGEAQRVCSLGVETEGSDESSSYHIANAPITRKRTEFPV